MPTTSPSGMKCITTVYALGLFPAAYFLNFNSPRTKTGWGKAGRVFDHASASAANNSLYLDSLVSGSGAGLEILSRVLDQTGEFFRIYGNSISELQRQYTEQLLKVSGLKYDADTVDMSDALFLTK